MYTTTGAESWRLQYRFGGKRKNLTFGLYSAVSLQQAHKEALEVLRRELKQNHGDCAPGDVEALRKLRSSDILRGAFVLALEKKVKASDVQVTPEILKRLVKETITPELAVRGMAAVLMQDAANKGFTLNPEAARAAAVEMYKAQGQPPAINSMAEARRFVERHANLARQSVQKAELLEGLNNAENMPAAHKDALEKAVNAPRLAFGQKCLPDLEGILGMDITSGVKLRSRLEEIAKNGPLTPEEFGRAVTENLKPVAQNYTMAEAIGQAMATPHGIRLGPAGRRDQCGDSPRGHPALGRAGA